MLSANIAILTIVLDALRIAASVVRRRSVLEVPETGRKDTTHNISA